MKRWIRSSLPGPACLVQKPKGFCTGGPPPAAAGHVPVPGYHTYRFMARGRAVRDGQLR